MSKRKSQIEIQQRDIKKNGEALQNMKKNHFEKKFNEILPEDGATTAANDQNFEIIVDNLIYRQEVIGQSIGGLNIYQLSFTSSRSTRNAKKQI